LPQVAFDACPADGDTVPAGSPLGLGFAASDAEQLYAWRVKVDGVVVDELTQIDATTSSGTVSWVPPAGDPPGSVYVVAVEAQDYGGNVTTAQRTFSQPYGTVLTGSQAVDSTYDGSDLSLEAGTFTLTGPVSLASLRLSSGAVLTADSNGLAQLTVSGEMRVQCGTVVDVNYLGYEGSTHYTVQGGAPAWVEGPYRDFGGSHGGPGDGWDYTGPAGETYDSVYAPRLGGGGGAVRHTTSSYKGGDGGGVVDLDVGTLVLDGEIRTRGMLRHINGYNEGSGAGGTVLVRAATVSGSGLIDASGGDFRRWSYNAGAGGGGRVAYYVDSFAGFDPAAQTKVWGGQRYDSGNNVFGYAGPGTIYVMAPGMTYGELTIDAGDHPTSGADRVGPATPLPTLGSGSVTLFEVSGSDAWVTGDAFFHPRWVGTWMVLDDGVGGDLGGYRVASVDAGGRALLEGASSVTGAGGFRGEYRFDRVDLLNGAGLVTDDPLLTSVLHADGSSQLDGPIATPNLEILPGAVPTELGSNVAAESLTVRSGATVTPPASQNGLLQLRVAGTLTVEAGAVLDVNYLGYEGSTHYTVQGGAPAWVEGPYRDFGGSHGGPGDGWDYSGPAGETYDSVYAPRLGGGGGALRHTTSGYKGGDGGGVIDLDVGTLVLDGEIRSRGLMRRTNGYNEASGAGGTVLVRAATVSGSGLIDASGGDFRRWSYNAG
ncbi:MAG TPA: hypothetical protein VKU40_18895, partial [Thermoanaerobaculia bacterium]|nr:hypothetical protein [Thermoanaerobaculia bacterium]